VLVAHDGIKVYLLFRQNHIHMYERENRNVLRRCLKTVSDGVEP